MRPGLKAGSIQVAFILVMLVIWFAVTSAGAIHPLLLPEPGKVSAQMQRIVVSGAYGNPTSDIFIQSSSPMLSRRFQDC